MKQVHKGQRSQRNMDQHEQTNPKSLSQSQTDENKGHSRNLWYERDKEPPYNFRLDELGPRIFGETQTVDSGCRDPSINSALCVQKDSMESQCSKILMIFKTSYRKTIKYLRKFLFNRLFKLENLCGNRHILTGFLVLVY